MLLLAVLGAEHMTRSLPGRVRRRRKRTQQNIGRSSRSSDSGTFEVSEIPMTLVSGKNPTEFAGAAEDFDKTG